MQNTCMGNGMELLFGLLIGIGIPVFLHHNRNVTTAALTTGIHFLALAAGAGTGHFLDVGQGLCALLQSCDDLTFGNMIAVAYQFMIFHGSSPYNIYCTLQHFDKCGYTGNNLSEIGITEAGFNGQIGNFLLETESAHPIPFHGICMAGL